MLKNCFILLCFTLLPSLCQANEKPTLNVVGESWVGSTNEDGSGIYFDIVKTLYEDDYQLNIQTTLWERAVKMVETGKADILVGSYPTENPALLYSNQHIDTEYPVLFIYDPKKIQPKSVDDLKGKLIAGKDGWGLENFLPQQAKFYGADSINSLARLISHNRVDGGLVYSYNLKLADPDNQLLNFEIAPALPIYLAFTNNNKGETLKDKADITLPKLISDGEIEALFPSRFDYQHANLLNSDDKKVNWYLIPKLINLKTEQLEINPWEFNTSKLITQTMPHVKMEVKTSSFAETKKELLIQENSCSINMRKPKESDNSVLYSDPIYVYIPPRLFVLKSSDLADDITNLLVDDKVNIKTLLDEQPKLKLVIKDSYGIHKKLINQLGDVYKHRIVDVARTDYEGLLNMLSQKRFDAIIIWPSIVTDIKSQEDNSNDLVSFELEQPLANKLLTYVACHNDEMGQSVIKQTNELLLSTDIYQPIMKSMDSHTAKAFRTALQER